MTETMTQDHSTEIEEMARRITDLCSESLAVLHQRQVKAADSASLDAEVLALRGEALDLEARNQSISERLTAAERMLRFENDRLVVLGKTTTPEHAKLAALVEELNAESAQLAERKRVIAERCEQIEAEKSTGLRRAAEQFKNDSIVVIRGAESALASILDATRDNLNTLETQLGASLYLPDELTADEKTSQWVTLNRMYRGPA